MWIVIYLSEDPRSPKVGLRGARTCPWGVEGKGLRRRSAACTLILDCWALSGSKGAMNSEPRVVAKHRLLVQEDGQQQVHVCDVHSWNDSLSVEHGVSGKLEVTTRRFTPSKTINQLPRFRLTLSSKADSSGLLTPFLSRLRSSRQVFERCGVISCWYCTYPWCLFSPPKDLRVCSFGSILVVHRSSH